MKAAYITFAESYLTSGNATEAYSVAYPNCTRVTALNRGSVLSHNPKIVEYMQEKQREISKKEIITREQVLRDLQIIINNSIYERPVVAIKAMELVSRIQGFEIKAPKEIKTDITTPLGEKITINLNLD